MTTGARVLVLAALLGLTSLAGAGPAHRDMSREAKAAAARGDYAEAARYYQLTADHYRKIGDLEAAFIHASNADQYEPVLLGYRERPAAAAELRRFFTGAKHEPLYGCYIGVNPFSDPNVRQDFDRFCQLVGKRHALVYDYAQHGRIHTFPLGQGAAAGPWLQAACELAQPLSSIAADDQLIAFAQALGRKPVPLFLRWASEMNGDWVPWGGDPALFIAKWRIVHDVMAQYAPNVAMVWCPNATPAAKIDRYYPGDAYVDWVGTNFYVVSIHNNDPQRPADRKNPAGLFRHVYEKYAARKPMMICETGVTHHAQALGRPDIAFAQARLGQLYGCLPRLYPRLKAICYFDVNNLQRAVNARRFNNYLLTDEPEVLATYRQAIAPDYFLSGPQDPAGPLPAYVERLAPGQTFSGTVRLSAWAKSWVMAPVVQYKLDQTLLAYSSAHGSYDCELDCSRFKPGHHTLTLTLLDRVGGRVLKQVSYPVRLAVP